MEQENELGVKPIKKLLWKLAVPAITAQIVNVLYNVVDRIYIGHIPEVGKLALTGVGVCMPLIMLISAFAMLAGMGGAPRASIMLGRNDAEEAERILGNCAALLILVAVTLTVLFQLFAKPFLLTFGAMPNLQQHLQLQQSFFLQASLLPRSLFLLKHPQQTVGKKQPHQPVKS